MIVGFHSHTMTLRGSENALWDYANFNETLLGNHSVICHRAELAVRENPVFKKWRKRFRLVSYSSREELASHLFNLGADILYQIKPGPFDNFVVPGLPNCIHAMFLTDEFHGDRFAFVSRWVSRVMTGREESFVPHFVPRLDSPSDWRGKLGIPRQAKVFGRHGGWDTFNIPFVRETVRRHADHHPKDHFVFLNTKPLRGTERMANVHYLPATVEPGEKAAFLATCDAMLHARLHGETFGLAVGEFAVLGKPVITFGGSRERAHLDMLGDQAQVYRNAEELCSLLKRFEPFSARGTAYETWSDPGAVMKIFRERFLEGWA
jgi:hypothetical protein